MSVILVSPGFGAGWSTWAGSDKKKEIAEYQPIINFIQEGGNPADLERGGEDHPLIQQMIKDLDLGSFYTGGASDLELQYVDGPYCIEEYDGSESVRTEADFW